MVVSVDAELDAALNEAARLPEVTPDALTASVLRERFLASAALQPRDEWERSLPAAVRDGGGSLPDSALSSEGLYD